MGRIPSTWGDRLITRRIPYSMAGELIIAGNTSFQFNDALFTNNIDMPLELHRMVPRVTALDAANNVLANQPSQEVLQSLARARIIDTGKANGNMTKNPTLLNLLTKGSAERTWEWAEPYYLIRSEGFQVSIDTLAYFAWDGAQIPQDPPVVPLVSLRIEIEFQGFLCVVAPASNTR